MVLTLNSVSYFQMVYIKHWLPDWCLGSLDDIIEMTSFGIIVYVMMWNIQIIFRGFNSSIFTNFSTPSRRVCPSLVLHRWRFLSFLHQLNFSTSIFVLRKVFWLFFAIDVQVDVEIMRCIRIFAITDGCQVPFESFFARSSQLLNCFKAIGRIKLKTTYLLGD